MTLPIGFVPLEIDVSGDGVWVAREGGATLIDRATGGVLREITAPPGTVRGRIIDKNGGATEYTTAVTVLDLASVLTAPPNQSGSDSSTARQMRSLASGSRSRVML